MSVVFSVHLPEELAKRFDALASEHGGRAPLVRKLVEEALALEDYQAPVKRRSDARADDPVVETLKLALTRRDVERLNAEVEDTGITKSQWLHACVRHRLHGARYFNRTDRGRLLGVQREFRAIAASLERMSRSLRLTLSRKPDLDVLAARIEAYHDTTVHLGDEIHRAFLGNDAYWKGETAAPEATTTRALETTAA